MQKEVYIKELLVRSEHIDALGHVNNEVYLKWVMEIAGEHWFRRAPEYLQKTSYWVVRRHELDYLKPSFEGDVLEISTWVEEISGVQSIRCVKITRYGEPVFQARTNWIMFNSKTNKPSRISQELSDRF